tara:strand:- start:24 stop:167 length:144 start_codon:yes stop_codon:yes gene_type:complete
MEKGILVKGFLFLLKLPHSSGNFFDIDGKNYGHIVDVNLAGKLTYKI